MGLLTRRRYGSVGDCGIDAWYSLQDMNHVSPTLTLQVPVAQTCMYRIFVIEQHTPGSIHQYAWLLMSQYNTACSFCFWLHHAGLAGAGAAAD